MYSREIQGREHTFGVSGKLIMNTLVMYDHQTRTLWAQSFHKGVDGPLKGAELEVIPAVHTEWALWRELHPDTLVLDDERGRFRGDRYKSYFKSRQAGIFGESVRDTRNRVKELVLGVEVDDHFKAYPFRLLHGQPVVNDELADRDLVVFFDTATETALAYLSEVDGRMLTFRLQEDSDGGPPLLVDNETGSTWMVLTGRAIEGELKGKTLERALSHLSFWFAWKDWNPQTELFTG